MAKSRSLTSAKAVVELAEWFSRQRRVLPWRENPEPYAIWISEVMLQQTQVNTVIAYFERWIKAFPTVESLAQASEPKVLSLWSGLGYYSRARNLKRGAESIVTKGRMPANRAEWLEVPGVGDYTSGAICSIALNQAEPIVDGNVERVFSRYFLLHRTELGEKNYKALLWERALEWVRLGQKRGKNPRDVNQSLMELGALVCTPRSPECKSCPLRSGCQAFKAGVVEKFPEKKVRPSWRPISETRVCILSPKGEVYLAGEERWRKGTLDFPEESRVHSFVSRALKEKRILSLGEVSTAHVVTCHKISRTTKVFRLKGEASAIPKLLKRSKMGSTEVPVNSATKKTWAQILKVFPGARQAD